MADDGAVFRPALFLEKPWLIIATLQLGFAGKPSLQDLKVARHGVTSISGIVVVVVAIFALRHFVFLPLF